MVCRVSPMDGSVDVLHVAWRAAQTMPEHVRFSTRGSSVTEQQRPVQDLFSTREFVRRGVVVLALISLALVLLLAARFA